MTSWSRNSCSTWSRTAASAVPPHTSTSCVIFIKKFGRYSADEAATRYAFRQQDACILVDYFKHRIIKTVYSSLVLVCKVKVDLVANVFVTVSNKPLLYSFTSGRHELSYAEILKQKLPIYLLGVIYSQLSLT